HSVVVQTSHHSKPLPYSARSTHFPYATLFRSMSRACVALQSGGLGSSQLATDGGGRLLRWLEVARHIPRREKASHPQRSHAKSRDRKSTRLNSSHVKISYAVLCLKKNRTRTYL